MPVVEKKFGPTMSQRDAGVSTAFGFAPSTKMSEFESPPPNKPLSIRLALRTPGTASRRSIMSFRSWPARDQTKQSRIRPVREEKAKGCADRGEENTLRKHLTEEPRCPRAH